MHNIHGVDIMLPGWGPIDPIQEDNQCLRCWPESYESCRNCEHNPCKEDEDELHK